MPVTPNKGTSSRHRARDLELRRSSRPVVVTGEKGEVAEGVVYFSLPADHGGEGVLECCVWPPLPRLDAGDVQVMAFFLFCLFWRSWWWLGKLVLDARGGGFASRASLQQLLAALFRHRVRLNGSRAATPLLLSSECWIPPVLRPKWCVPSGLAAGQRRSFDLEEEGGVGLDHVFKFSLESFVPISGPV
jgi:hypothetical protein